MDVKMWHVVVLVVIIIAGTKAYLKALVMFRYQLQPLSAYTSVLVRFSDAVLGNRNEISLLVVSDGQDIYTSFIYRAYTFMYFMEKVMSC
ncbi:hypothetical protein RUM43_006935 [Polyplax serrata]|uniref:Uncharacterized protein n=1 Tax=Polyplax serrata TaxID=468196 RepID=A0AAN8Q5H4_POLSC